METLIDFSSGDMMNFILATELTELYSRQAVTGGLNLLCYTLMTYLKA